MAERRAEFCSEVSLQNAEPLAGTASRVDHWILVEYRGVWARRELEESLVPTSVKEHLRKQLGAVPRSRLLFVASIGVRDARRDASAILRQALKRRVVVDAAPEP